VVALLVQYGQGGLPLSGVTIMKSPLYPVFAIAVNLLAGLLNPATLTM